MTAQLNFGLGNSVTFGTTGVTTGAVLSCSSAAISNIQVGDLLVAWIHSQTTATGSITPPTGWVQYGAQPGQPNFSTSRSTSFYYYTVKSQSDITNLPSTLSWTFSSSSGRLGGILVRATGIDLNAPEDSKATIFSGGGTTSLAISGITTLNATTLLVGGFFHENSISTASPNTTSFLSSFQEYRTNPDATVANTGVAMGYQYLTTAGATGTVTANMDNTATVLGGELVAFKAGAWSPGSGTTTATPTTVVGTPTAAVSATPVTSFTIATPSGLQDNDLLVLALSAQSSNVTSDFSSSGWSRLSQGFTASSATYRLIAFYGLAVPVASNAASSYTFTATDSGTGGRIAAEMFIVRGANLTSPVTATSAYGTLSGSNATVQPGSPSVSSNLLLVAYNANYGGNVDYTLISGPTGLTQQNFIASSTTASDSKTTLAIYQANINNGSQAADTLTYAAPPSQASGVALAIRSAGVLAANVQIHYTSAPNTLATGGVYYTSAPNTLSQPAELRIVPTGYASVTAMLAATPFYVAHRGGSVDWPEMSLYAYTQSVFWGAGALEVSLARTSDGVWFGLHDASLDRTSLNNSNGTTLTASTMTWAQVQQYNIQYPSVHNPGSLPQPYMRWEQIIAAYYGTHILFIDPKYAATYTSELLAMMDALPNTPSNHFVAKSYGVTGNTANTTGWPHDAAAHGYKTWGYFYEADYSNVPTYQGRYDILGMDYTATQSSWTQILSYSKPVMGHIVPTASAATTALNFGAQGLMVSGVQEVIPRSTSGGV